MGCDVKFFVVRLSLENSLSVQVDLLPEAELHCSTRRLIGVRVRLDKTGLPEPEIMGTVSTSRYWVFFYGRSHEDGATWTER